MLFALIDAEYVTRSARVTGRYLIYPLTGIVLLYWLLKPGMALKLLWGTVIVMLIWSVDGLIQFFTGSNLFGHTPSYGGIRLTGMFYPWPHLGVVLAILLPVYLEGLYRLSRKTSWAGLLILPVLAVILLGGGRSSWMLAIIAVIIYLVYFFMAGRRFSLLKFLILGVLSLSLIISIVWNVDWLNVRAKQTLEIFSEDYALVNRATSLRLPIWDTAINMSKAHWLNGIGARAFQNSYQDYSTPDDPFYNEPAGHPHLFFLEVAAETGGIGIMAYLAFLAIIIRQIKATLKTVNEQAIPWGLAALIAAFPLSSTMSFYASFSSCLMWFLVIVFIAFSCPVVPTKNNPNPD